MEQVQARKQSIISNQSALEATEIGYQVGTRNIVDVLDAQRQLYSAVRNYNDARYDYILNNLRLKQAAGTLSPADLEALPQHRLIARYHKQQPACWAQILDAALMSRCTMALRCDDFTAQRQAALLGLGIALPSVDYLAALALIAASGAAAATQFGALVAFSVVNLSVIKHYFIDAGEKNVLNNLVLPLIGFLLTVWLWTSLSWLTLEVGLAWLAVGFVWLLVMTRGFSRPTPTLDLKE